MIVPFTHEGSIHPSNALSHALFSHTLTLTISLSLSLTLTLTLTLAVAIAVTLAHVRHTRAVHAPARVVRETAPVRVCQCSNLCVLSCFRVAPSFLVVLHQSSS